MQLRCLHADIQTFLDIFGKHTGKLLTAVKGRKVKWLRAAFKMFKQQCAMSDAHQHACADLPLQIVLYKQRFGCLPAELQADKLYLNRANRAYLKNLGIKCHCAPLGRPPKHLEVPRLSLEISH